MQSPDSNVHADPSSRHQTAAESRVLVTGASGFIGSCITGSLAARGYAVRTASRRAQGRTDEFIVGEIGPDTDWSTALENIDCVVHLAGRAHILSRQSHDALTAYRRINAEGTRRLAIAAAEAGVRRLVFISSIKVNGEATADRPFHVDDPPAPHDPYGVSKLEAERALADIAAQSALQICILRPPLVYGPGVKGNLELLINWIRSGKPLPLGAVRNKRSLISLHNLQDLITRCIWHPNAGNATFLVSDGADLSTPELIEYLAQALGTRANLVSLPLPLLRIALTLAGRGDQYRRLCSSLQIDSSDCHRKLAWQPSISIREGIERMVAA